jgi:hypothetical protein
MRKYGVSVEDLAQGSPSTASPQATTSAPPGSPAWQEIDPGRRAAYDYWPTHGVYSDDAFVTEVFSRRSALGRKRLPRVARIIAGFGITGLAVFIIWDIGQMFSGDESVAASATASQAQSPTYVSSPSSAPRQPPSAGSASSSQVTIPGVYQELYEGHWFKFTVGQDGKVAGTPIAAYTRWPNVPVWK